MDEPPYDPAAAYTDKRVFASYLNKYFTSKNLFATYLETFINDISNLSYDISASQTQFQNLVISLNDINIYKWR